MFKKIKRWWLVRKVKTRPYIDTIINVQTKKDGYAYVAWARIWKPTEGYNNDSFEVDRCNCGIEHLPNYWCPVCGTYDLATGRHITWGQGRHDLDEYPRLTPESLRHVQWVKTLDWSDQL